MKKMTQGQKIYNVFNVAFLFLLMVACLYPFYYVICASFSTSAKLQVHRGWLFAPIQPTLGAYRKTFDHPLIISGFINTLKIIGIGLPINMLITLLAAYFISSNGMMFKGPIVAAMTFTMFFSGGLIPGYLNVKSLGLIDTVWALTLPGCLSMYNAIILKTALGGVPESLHESAFIDGANDLRVLFQILVPLVVPTLAVLLLYYGVGHWNSWFSATIYMRKNENMPLQAIMRAIVIENETLLGGATEIADDSLSVNDFTETIKYAVIVISTLPILCLYPFLQRFFVKGVMIGAVKG